VKAVLFALLVLLGCQTPGRDMDVETTPLADETSEDLPFAEPSFYAKWVKKPVVLYVGSDNQVFMRRTPEEWGDNEHVGQ
jgi:hypothetical protein